MPSIAKTILVKQHFKMWQRSDIWSQALYRYPISWEAFWNPSDSYLLFADFLDFSTHWTYIFRRISLSNYWWQKSDIWSQASHRYAISSDSYFLFADLVGFYPHWTDLHWAWERKYSFWHCPLMLTAGYPKALIPFHVPNKIPSTWPVCTRHK
jgi:hypothetical protein